MCNSTNSSDGKYVIAKPFSACLCFNKIIFLYYIKYQKKPICIMHSDVYKPMLHLRGGGGGGILW